jgi:hypothetical protein
VDRERFNDIFLGWQLGLATSAIIVLILSFFDPMHRHAQSRCLEGHECPSRERSGSPITPPALPVSRVLDSVKPFRSTD